MSTDRSEMVFHTAPGGWLLGRFDRLARAPGVEHGVSTTVGPNGANLRDDAATAKANRQSLAEAIGARDYAAAQQVHGGSVVAVDEPQDGRVEADALMSDRVGLALLGLSADCPIVLVADTDGRAVGMAHASWRGTVARVTAALVAGMQKAYGCPPGRMAAGICPSAGPCCYEVGGEVRQAAANTLGPGWEDYFLNRDGRTYFDLWRANVQQLTSAGIPEQNIAVAGVCTICDDRFYSYRRDGALAGRFGAAIAKV
jgi:YfiH family protein